jgi:glycosyltransferase involved in cell wall biosynthesis
MTNVQQKIRKKVRQLALYLLLGRLTDSKRRCKNQVRRLSLVLSQSFVQLVRPKPAESQRARLFINVCVPNLHNGNNFSRVLARRFGRNYLIEEYFPSKRRSFQKRTLGHLDIFHLHFIDALRLDHAETVQLIGELHAAKIKIVITAHDLTPHTKQPEFYDPIFQAWLGAADGVIHHSNWGMGVLESRYEIPASTKHTIIANLGGKRRHRGTTPSQRARAESALGLKSIPIRIGILGMPRKERLVKEFLQGFAMTERQDMEVACWSLSETDPIPDDPRIVIAERHKHVGDHVFRKRSRACDVIAVPYQEDGEMLSTGVTRSALDVGVGVLRTNWPFIVEVFGDAGIYIGSDVASFAGGLSELTVDEVQRAKLASLELGKSNNWRQIAQKYEEFYELILSP